MGHLAYLSKSDAWIQAENPAPGPSESTEPPIRFFLQVPSFRLPLQLPHFRLHEIMMIWFVSGHGFSHAEPRKEWGFSPW